MDCSRYLVIYISVQQGFLALLAFKVYTPCIKTMVSHDSWAHGMVSRNDQKLYTFRNLLLGLKLTAPRDSGVFLKYIVCLLPI